MGSMLPYIAAPWIRHGLSDTKINISMVSKHVFKRQFSWYFPKIFSWQRKQIWDLPSLGWAAASDWKVGPLSKARTEVLAPQPDVGQLVVERLRHVLIKVDKSDEFWGVLVCFDFGKNMFVGGSSLKSTIEETNIWKVTSVDKCGGCGFSRCNGQKKSSPNSCKLQGKQLSHYKRLVTTVGPCFCMFLYQTIRFGSNYRDNCSEIAEFIPNLHFLLP